MNHYRYGHGVLVFILLFYSNNCANSDASPLIDRTTDVGLIKSELVRKVSTATGIGVASIEEFTRSFKKILHLASVNIKSKIISQIENNRDRNGGQNGTSSEIESEMSVEENTDWSEFEENVKNDVINEYVLRLLSSESGTCMMHGFKEQWQFWAYPNGSLAIGNVTMNLRGSPRFVDKSYQKRNTDEILEAEITYECNNKIDEVIAFSAAYNDLKKAPFKTLRRMRKKLQYLMLKGNNFVSHHGDADQQKNELGIPWATFPELPALRELDISNCKIEFIASHAFINLTNLTTLYISHNKIMRVPWQSFSYIRNIKFLDLSNQNALDIDLKIPIPELEQIVNLLVGVRIEMQTFKDLSKLTYLDLSHTKLTKSSSKAFNYLPRKLKYLSLCYSSFPLISTTLFKNTKLEALDMSGNSFAVYSMVEESFLMVAKTLKALFFEGSNIKDLGWLKKLKRLEIASFSSNSIDNTGFEILSSFENLQVLDLSSNHIGNWYSQVFANNTRLRILNLRNNNINILTSEMMKDFQHLQYLGIGDNDFVCDCVLRDFIDIAVANNHREDCLSNVIENTQNTIEDNIKSMNIPNEYPNFYDNYSVEYLTVVDKYKPIIKNSYANLKKRFSIKAVTSYFKSLTTNPCPNTNQIILYDKINGSSMKFQLLDYEDVHYWCFNETEKMAFFELNCQPRSFDDMIINSIRNVTEYVVIGCSILLFIAMVIVVGYIKRWHIHYYWSSLKSAALLSVAAKEKTDSLYNLSESESNLVYDIFISYCQNDRPWVLEELMPNIEIAGDLSICMHERDFEVGVPILDNIISCMDRSRCLMLLISTNFLLSHWCQFEMRLAQHRMFEASKEHVILVFLEDIPKCKRPKTLQYLMDVKTYIKWPSGSSPNSKLDEKKLFWKRLRRSLNNI